MARGRNRKGIDDLNAQISKIRKLSSLPKRSEPALRKAVESQTKSDASKGIGPDGKPYRRSLKGEAVLKNAAKAITVTVTSAVILIKLTGRNARHHLGIVRGSGSRMSRARPIIPTNDIPKATTKAMKRAAVQEFRRVMK